MELSIYSNNQQAEGEEANLDKFGADSGPAVNVNLGVTQFYVAKRAAEKLKSFAKKHKKKK